MTTSEELKHLAKCEYSLKDLMLKAASELEALQKEAFDWKYKYEQLQNDIDEEMVRLASRAAQSFIANAKRELESVGNVYIGHIGNLEGVVRERNSLSTQNQELRSAIEEVISHRREDKDRNYVLWIGEGVFLKCEQALALKP